MKTRMTLCSPAWMTVGAVLLLGMGIPDASALAAQVLEGITFAEKPGVWYVGMREAAEALGWPVHWETKSRTVYVNNRLLSDARLKRLPDGTLLVAVRDLQQVGGDVQWKPDTGRAILAYKDRQIPLRMDEKRVVIDRTKQELRAYQGKRLVLKSRISTGRQGKKTPAGTFRAGPYKARMHYSSLYDNAPMPWSVQVVGDIFVHGYQSVPGRPASHGCIRLPLDEGNPAKWFYHWVSIGTPVEITGRWRG